MKLRVIIGVFAIVGFTSLLMYNFGQSINTYTDFEDASGMETAHVVGKLDTTQAYGFSMDTKQFSFYMKDQQNNVRKVVYPKPKPNNFEQAKKLVVIGSMRNNVFYANDMLMKCPSKYNDSGTDKFQNADKSL